MGIVAPTNVINIYQTVLSNQFTSQTFIVSNGSIKNYDLGEALTLGTDVVLLNGLYQVKGPSDAYTVSGTEIIFNADTVLTPGDEIVVYYEKEL